jgi:opacity protein-like surface antigen
VRVVRQEAVIAVLGLGLLAFPPSARSDSSEINAILLGLGSAVLVGSACAGGVVAGEESDADEDAYARQGWLAGVGGSYAIEVFEDDVVADFQNSFGVNGRAGYRCHPRFSAEVEVEWLDGFETVISDSKFGKIFAFDAEPLVVTVNTKGYLLTGRYQPFVLLGMGAMMADLGVRDLVAGLPGSVSETGFAMRFGGGIDFYATKHVVVSVEADYVLPFDDLEGLDYISIGLGLQYRF